MPRLLQPFAWCLFVLLVGATFVRPVHAQQGNCPEILQTAQSNYDLGRFDDVISLLQPCLDSTAFSDEERRRAYRLMGLSYLAKDAENDAREAVKNLLELVPNYQTNPVEDPPTFVRMVEDVRREMGTREQPSTEPTPPPQRPTQAKSGGGIGKWLLIGGGVAAAAVIAYFLLREDDNGGEGEVDGPRVVNEVEPNNFLQTAQNISGSSPIRVHGSAEAADIGDIFITDNLQNGQTFTDDMEDLFRINTQETGIRITLSGFDEDCDLYLIDTNLTILGQSTNNGTNSETISIPSLQPGSYIITVSIFDPLADDENRTPLNNAGSTEYVLDVVVGQPAETTFALRESPDQQVSEQAQSYRLVGLAGSPNVPLAEVMAQAGEASWYAFQETGMHARGYEHSDAFAFKTGSGFWVRSATSLPPVQATEPVALDADGTAHIAVQPGWNIITNPFETDLDWRAVQALNGTAQKLWAWHGSYSATDHFASGTSQEAFYFYNDVNRDVLRIPPVGFVEKETLALPTLPRDVLTLTALRDGERASSVAVGFSPFAALGRDPLDQYAPPGYFETASLRLFHPAQTQEQQPLVLAEDYRPRSAEGHTFDVVLAAPVGEPITLAVEGLSAFAGYDVALIDTEHLETHDLRRSSVLTLMPQAAETSYRLVIGSADYVRAARAELAGDAMIVSNYPNPFNPSTRISYTIPASVDGEAVQLEVFNVLGQRVRLLVDAAQPAGSYEVTWDGRDDTGAQVASGVYLYRLRAGSTQATGRMLMAK